MEIGFSIYRVSEVKQILSSYTVCLEWLVDTAFSTVTTPGLTPRITPIIAAKRYRKPYAYGTAGTLTELTERLTEMNAQIQEWEGKFDVESPNQLGGTLAD